jgi:peptidoglycan hydrolase-like protein with peptidoglycan-binding domain
MKRQLVKKGFIDWKEVICSDQINIELVKKVQKALTDKGYDAGPVDGAWGSKSLDAMNKFQGEKNLPITKVISLETLQALGVQR